MLTEEEVKELNAQILRRTKVEEEEFWRGIVRVKRRPREFEDDGGCAFSRPASFDVPGPAFERPVSKDGRVTFHLNHSTVSKQATYGNVEGAWKCVISSGKAAGEKSNAGEHESYISRDGQIAATAAKNYEAYIDEGGGSSGQAIFTNIHPDLDRRVEFWERVAERERTPNRDRLSLNVEAISEHLLEPSIERLLEFKDLSDADRQCLEMVAEGLLSGPEISIEIPFKQFSKFRSFLKKQDGWHKDIATMRRGRGGRVQRRLVAELPDGLDAPARWRIAKRLADTLERLGFMYTLVIHEPDAHNDGRNYHLHAAIYDRPCRYLEDKQCWDFDYATKAPGQYRLHYPERQEKLAWFSKRAASASVGRKPARSKGGERRIAQVLRIFRMYYANCCNRELRAAESERLYDHRSYHALGIDQEPATHLGPRAAQLEVAGVATKVGSDNTEKSWQGSLTRLLRANESRVGIVRDALEEAGDLLTRARDAELQDARVTSLRSAISQLREKSASSELELTLGRLDIAWRMARSRAERTLEKCDRLLEMDGDGSGARSKRPKILARRAEAEQHLYGLDREFGDRIAAIHQLRIKAVRDRTSTDELLKQVTGDCDVLHGLLAERKVEPIAGMGSDHGRGSLSRYTKRQRQLIAAWKDDPMGYEEELDRVLHDIDFFDKEITPPLKEGEIYKVPGLQKEDLEFLLNPIFEKRIQARLQAICVMRKAREQRARERKLEAALEEKTKSNDLERAAAIEEAIQSCRTRSNGSLPIKMGRDDLCLDLARFPEEAATFLGRMDDQVVRVVAEKAEAVRNQLSEFLNSFADQIEEFHRCGYEFGPLDYPEEVRRELRWLRVDPVAQKLFVAAGLEKSGCSPSEVKNNRTQAQLRESKRASPAKTAPSPNTGKMIIQPEIERDFTQAERDRWDRDRSGNGR